MDEPIVPERVKTPSGRIIDGSELRRISRDDLEARRARVYYKLVASLHCNDKESYYSFVDDADIESCRGKYDSAL